MNTSILKNWWLFLLNGLAAMLFGGVALFYPETTLRVLVGYFGVLAIFLGVFLVLAALMNRSGANLWTFWLLEGILNLVIGAVILVYPEITVSVFLVVLAIWAILIGAIQLISAFQLRRVVRHRWPFVVNGSLALLFGIIILVNPFREAVVLTLFVGGYSVVLG
ncbi:MAG: DUF308 domain-containing protein, partial [Tunicatimonas sp.]